MHFPINAAYKNSDNSCNIDDNSCNIDDNINNHIDNNNDNIIDSKNSCNDNSANFCSVLTRIFRELTLDVFLLLIIN